MITDRLEQLVEEMVDKGVQFEDAVHEFEKRFIARVLGQLRRQPHQDRRRARHPPQHADAQDGRVQDQEARDKHGRSEPAQPVRSLPCRVSSPRLTLPTAAHIISSRQERVLTRPAPAASTSGSSERHLHLTTDGVQSMNVRPLHDRIIVQRLEEGEQKIGGIIIPDTRQGKAAAGQGHRRRQRQGEGRRQAHPARRQGRRPHPVRQVLRPGDQARWRGVPHHARGRSPRRHRGRRRPRRRSSTSVSDDARSLRIRSESASYRRTEQWQSRLCTASSRGRPCCAASTSWPTR